MQGTGPNLKEGTHSTPIKARMQRKKHSTPRLDKNGDGGITVKEFEAALAIETLGLKELGSMPFLWSRVASGGAGRSDADASVRRPGNKRGRCLDFVHPVGLRLLAAFVALGQEVSSGPKRGPPSAAVHRERLLLLSWGRMVMPTSMRRSFSKVGWGTCASQARKRSCAPGAKDACFLKGLRDR